MSEEDNTLIVNAIKDTINLLIKESFKEDPTMIALTKDMANNDFKIQRLAIIAGSFLLGGAILGGIILMACHENTSGSGLTIVTTSLSILAGGGGFLARGRRDDPKKTNGPWR